MEKFKKYFFVVTIFLGLSLAIIFAFLDKADSNLKFSVIIGMLGVIIGIQIDSLIRMVDSLKKRASYDELISNIERNEWLGDEILNISSTVINILDKNGGGFFSKAVEKQVKYLSSSLENIQNGRISVPYHETGVLETFVVKEIKNKSLTVTIIDEHWFKWWNSNSGQLLYSQSIDTITKGASIERIFIIKSSISSEIQKVLDIQSEAGIEVYTIHKDVLREEQYAKFTIYDNSFLHYIDVNAEGIPVFNIFSSNLVEIENKNKIYNSIKTLAKKYQRTNNNIENK